jgi:hypothetical protein
MTQAEANTKVLDILGQLVPLGLFPPGAPMVLPGNLVAAAHPEHAEFWRPVFTPHANGLMPLDFEETSPATAARHLSRYRFRQYLELRRKMEEVFAALADDGFSPISYSLKPDSFIIGPHRLESEEDFRGNHTMAYRLILETHPMMQIVKAGEEIPESKQIDVAELTVEALVKQIRLGISKALP